MIKKAIIKTLSVELETAAMESWWAVVDLQRPPTRRVFALFAHKDQAERFASQRKDCGVNCDLVEVEPL